MEQRSEIEFKKPVFDGVQHTLTMESGQKVILEPFQNFSNMIFVECDLSRLSLTSCNFSGCKFINCQVVYTEFSHSDFSEATFIDSDISGSAFLWGTLYKATFRNCSLERARFNYAKMSKIVFDSCNLTTAEFMKSALRKSVFKKCVLDSCEMAGSEMKNSFFEEVSAHDGKWRLVCVDLSGSTFLKCQTTGVAMCKCTLKHVFFDQSNLWRSRFWFSDFTKSIAVHTGFNESKLRDCVFVSCEFTACRLRTTNFDRSIFELNKISFSSLESANFSSAVILSMEMVDNYCGTEDQFPTKF